MSLYRRMADDLTRAWNRTGKSSLQLCAGGLKGGEKGRSGLGAADLCEGDRVRGWIESSDGGCEGIGSDFIGASREKSLCNEAKKGIRIGGRETRENSGGIALSFKIGRRSRCSRRKQLLQGLSLHGGESRENFTHTHRLGHGKWVRREGGEG
jgi:hypothetical protein